MFRAEKSIVETCSYLEYKNIQGMLCFDWRSIFIFSLQTQGVVFCQCNVAIYYKQESGRLSQ